MSYRLDSLSLDLSVTPLVGVFDSAKKMVFLAVQDVSKNEQ